MYILIESLEAVEVTRHDDMSCLRFKEDATSVTVRMVISNIPLFYDHMTFIFTIFYCLYTCCKIDYFVMLIETNSQYSAI